MPSTVSLHQLSELAQGSEKNRCMIETNLNTELDIRVSGNETIIRFPFGNKFDIVDGEIIIHEKRILV